MKRPLAQVSIRRRFVLQLAAIAALLSLVFFLGVRAIAERAAADTQDNILAASTISQDRVFYRVLDAGTTLTGYDDLPVVSPGTSEPKFYTFSYRGEEVRQVVVTRGLSTGDTIKDVTVAVAQTRLGLEAVSSRITATATAVGLLFFLVATALSLFAAQTALRPLKNMAASVTRRGPNDLRPVTGNSPTELAPLVDALNSFISRLKSSLLRSEDFIAEAAHRVRTPLSTVRTQAEVIYRRLENKGDRDAVREMIRAVDESSRSAGQLLDHAMVTFRSDQFVPVDMDLGQLLQETCDRLRPTADLKDIDITTDILTCPLPFSGDPVLLQNALRNILDNAIKYSPADSQISVRITNNKAYHISFKDQGRGFEGADIANLSGRFSRGSNVSDIVGSGLGLTIVEEVARAHSGHVIVASNEGGPGACVTLVLPLH
jgi:two-component system sensor histidine kinase TctE